ncbi:MAG: hypothetical protein E7576_06520 [Ruminococcaceae bacterium]|jgi:uncharacterized FlaG/YvyC family protein|nr:hypothetical protein [Oscillospiraceae bacterium]
MKKSLSVLLAALLLASSLAACSTNTENAAEEQKTTQTNTQTPTADLTEEVEETARFLDSMPEEMNFEGRGLNFLLTEGANGNITEQSIWAEEDTGEVVDAAVFKRNLTVTERLNIVINQPIVSTDSGANGNSIRNAVKSGSAEYDVFGGYQYYNIVLASEGMLLNLNNKDNFPYNDFDREYWGSGYMKNMSYDGQKMYWATGDLALRYTGGMYVTYVNSKIFTDFYPDVNLYAIVDEGEWTMDKIAELAKSVYIDLNADGKKDKKDQFGFVLQSIDPTDGMAAGCMVDFSSRNEAGLPYITLDNERTYTFWDKYYALMFNNEGVMLNPETDDSVAIMTNFGAGQYMMTCNKLFQSPIYLRDMEDDFKILPLPKLNVEQEHYNTRIHDSCTIFGVPVTVGGTDCISASLEALASESFKEVTPAYYEIALKVKFTRDSDSGRMIELVHENVTIDFAAQWSNKLGDINHFFRKCADAGNEAIASTLQKNQKVWDKSMSKLVSSLEGLDD